MSAKQKFAGNFALLIVLLMSVAVRLPSARWDAISDDEGIYDAMAVVINQGGLMYREAVDHKPPGLAYTYAWVARLRGLDATSSERIAAIHLFGALVALGTSLGLHTLGRSFLPSLARLWPPLLFAISSTAKIPFDGLAVNGELLMGLPSVWCLVLINLGGRLQRCGRVACDFSAGALLSIAVLYKWQAGLLFVPMAWMGLRSFERLSLIRWIGRTACWLMGSGFVFSLVAYGFWVRGGLNEAIEWGLYFNRQYLAAGTHGWFWWTRLAQGLVGAVLPSFLLYAFGLATMTHWLRHARIGTTQSAVAVWAALSLGAVALGGRFFGHYFLQAELPLCLLAAQAISAYWRQTNRPTRIIGLLLGPWFCFMLLAIGPDRALELLNPEDPKWRTIGQSIRTFAQPGDTLFVWGNAPLLYHFADLPMGTRFSFCNYMTGVSPATPSEKEVDRVADKSCATRKGNQELEQDFLVRRPTFLFDSAAGNVRGYGLYPLQEQRIWSEFIAQDYKVVKSYVDGVLYKKTF